MPCDFPKSDTARDDGNEDVCNQSHLSVDICVCHLVVLILFRCGWWEEVAVGGGWEPLR
jgi:hypothetical protein